MRNVLWAVGIPSLVLPALLAVLVVPTEIQQPGTQPDEVSNLGSVTNCDNCHGGYDAAVEPAFNWRGSMMAHAARDPLFWATFAIAEQDLPGAGDLCLRCHTPRAWLEGRSTPTDGSALTSSDVDGTECAICHKMVNPDDSEHIGVQNAPFLAHDDSASSEGYYGSGMLVMWDGKERMGPYDDSVARHSSRQSAFHRSADFCGTCHDVSNPAVGDLAHNNGAQVPLPPGTFSGVPGEPVDLKAAFNNFPFAYGIVERTYSEHKASLWPDTPVSSYDTLPLELRDGAIELAWQNSRIEEGVWDYEDGTERYFTCQTCHLPAVSGKGCDKHNAWTRNDLPLHDLTGGNYWVPDVIRYLDDRDRLRVGGGLTQLQIAALEQGKQRALGQLRRAASMSVSDDTLRVVNLTGHKLISGYPEGRRMWLNVVWKDTAGTVLREDGAYGPIGVNLQGNPLQVETIVSPGDPHTKIYQAKPGMTKEWANQLLALGIPNSLPLEYDSFSGSAILTLGQLAAMPSGTARETFHFALNNTLVSDNRIPPFGMRRDEATLRNALPVPDNQYVDPGQPATYRYWDEVQLVPPPGAASARIDLKYQPTSWEYIQFLYLANDKQNPFLASLGDDLLDAWLNTGMASPQVMSTAIWCRLPGSGEDFVLSTRVNGVGDPADCAKAVEAGDQLDIGFASPGGTFVGVPAGAVLQFYPTGQPPVSIPGVNVHVSEFHGQIVTAALPSSGLMVSTVIPPGLGGHTLRLQAAAITPLAANGVFAVSDAHDILLR